MSVEASKNNLARELFVRTADENYVTARWCATNRLNTDFLWLAVHALEKYLKATLLVNGQDTRGYGHDVVRLYRDVKAFAGPLLPDRLTKPAGLDIFLWRERSAEEFMAHLLDNGNADNRYAIYGYVTSTQDLHMLDAMVFAIRRLVCELDGRVFAGDEPDLPIFTHRDILTRQPNYYGRMGMPLDELIGTREDTRLRQAALNLNLPFAPADFAHRHMPEGAASSNPVIIRRILDPLASDDPGIAAEGIEIARWFLANVQLPRGTPSSPSVREQILEAVDMARTRHRLP
ncbi:HEPN domain-containing protein [Bradyrhizobium sp. 144]|uniref:HEPN domain-containing protein n=1 Tax=Bradyrhizobium sp. 144 TaxID=2782620 RepID=UPI001FF72B1A|nr:HEPN domain-containing protein [Bradyrhizobium sp. 144]